MDQPGSQPTTPSGEDSAEGDTPLGQWREAYDACECGLRAFLRGRLSQEVDVDDCLQAVCVKMIRQADKEKQSDKKNAVAPMARRSWLFRVAANEAAALWRRKASTDRMMNRHGASEIAQSDATDKLILTETTDKVRQALNKLPPEWGSVVRLRIEQNLTFREIAEQLQIPLGTALTRMRRALERIRDELHPDDPSD